jgi:predicted TIM-barrel fold metal-dependent hydrolase
MTNTTEYNLVSADSHVIEPGDLFEKRLPSALRKRAPKLESWNGGSAWLMDGTEPITLPTSAATGSGYKLRADSKPIAFDEVLPAMYDPAERLLAQDADSVDAEILYPSPDLWDAIRHLDDAELKLACVRAYNDWIAEFSAHHPDRLIGLGKIPSTSPKDAEEELVRCVKELKLRGVILEAWPGDKSTGSDPTNDPFWATAHDAGVPVSIHYSISGEARSAPSSGIVPGLRPPMADAALPMVASGVFDRFPDLKVVLAHGDAGWTLHWLEFTDINYIRHRHLAQYALANPDAVPSEYIRRHFFFTIHQDRSAVRNRAKIGTTHLLWASHLPLDAADWPDDRRQAIRLTEELPDKERRALLAENTARLYRLPGYEEGIADTPIGSFAKFVHF